MIPKIKVIQASVEHQINNLVNDEESFKSSCIFNPMIFLSKYLLLIALLSLILPLKGSLVEITIGTEIGDEFEYKVTQFEELENRFTILLLLLPYCASS